MKKFCVLLSLFVFAALVSCKDKETVDAAVQPPACRINSSGLTAFEYDAAGRLTSFAAAALVSSALVVTYNTVSYTDGKPSTITVFTNQSKTGRPLAVLNVTTDGQGQITSVAKSDNSGSVSFEYSNHRQLIKATLSNGAYYRVEYDAAGNITNAYTRPAGSNAEQKEVQYTTYDNKKSPYTGNIITFAAVTGHILLISSNATLDYDVLSANNPTAATPYQNGQSMGTSTYTYVYSTQDYPTQVTRVDQSGSSTVTVSVEYGYNCP